MSFGFGIGDFIAVLQLAKEVRRGFVDAPEQFKAISADVKHLTTVLEDIDDIISERDLTNEQKARIEDVAQGCNTILLELKAALYTYQGLDSSSQATGVRSRKLWKRFKWDQKDIEEFRSRISLNINAFDAILSLIDVKVSLVIKTGVDRLHERKDDQERRDEYQAILEWLTPIAYNAQQHDYLSRREEDTGQWFLDSAQFKSWLDQRNPTLFCPGIPGAGKTIMSAIVVDFLQNKFENDDSVGVAYLYFNFRRQYEQKPADLFASLLKQFVNKLSSMPDSLKNLCEKHNKTSSRPSCYEFVQVLLSVIPRFSKTFIIVDALDECQVSDGGYKSFLSEFFNFQEKSRASLLATSRPIPSIEKMFHGSLLLEIRARDTDVRRYLQSQLQMRQLPKVILSDTNLQEEIKTGIIKAVDGMFLLAELHLRSLVGKMTRKAIRNTLRKLIAGSQAYNVAYTEAMERIEVGDAPEFAKLVLSWITFAKRPLTTVELRHALAVEVGEPEFDEENLPDIEDIVSVCAGLVTVDEESDIVRLVHYTTQEFFEQTQKSWFPDAEKDITMICVTYLALETFETGFCSTDDEFEARRQTHPLYEYAACNWGRHARACLTVERLILNFLENKARVSAASQAMMFERYHSSSGYSQRVTRNIEGFHLTAYFGLEVASVGLIESGVNPDSKDEYGQTPLSYAAENGHEAVVKLLLATGNVDVNTKNKFGQTPLSYATENGHETVVKLLLATGNVDPDANDTYDRRTPLSDAARKGYEAVVELLLATENVDPDSKDRMGQTPLSYAAENGHEAVVKLLLATRNVDLDTYDTYNRMTPLSCAAKNGHEAVVELLLATGNVDLNSKDVWGYTPLSGAAKNGHEAVVELLLATGNVDLNNKDVWGYTPLSNAAHNGHEAVVKLLLATGNVDVNIKNKYGQAPLLYAAEFGFEAIVKLLLATDSINPDSKGGEKGRTPLSLAAIHGHEAIFKLLLATDGVNPDSKDENGYTPLVWAASFGHEAIFKLLLSTDGVDRESKDTCGQTPLSHSTANGHEAIVKLLLSAHGVDPDSRDENGQTPLSWAARYGREAIVKLLLATDGVDPDSKDESGQTPLYYAASYGHDETVKVLLATNSVDPDSKDENGQTPLSWAIKQGHEAIVELLLATDGRQQRL